MAIDVFISYAREDRTIAAQLAAIVERDAVVIWDRDFTAGERFERDIEDAVRRCAAFIVLVSAASIESSWVAREIALALESGAAIVPVRLDDTELPDTISRFNAIDLRAWAGADDDPNLAKLINDVRLHRAARAALRLTPPPEVLPSPATQSRAFRRKRDPDAWWTAVQIFSVVMIVLAVVLSLTGAGQLALYALAAGLAPFVLSVLATFAVIAVLILVVAPILAAVLGFRAALSETFNRSAFAGAAAATLVALGGWAIVGPTVSRMIAPRAQISAHDVLQPPPSDVTSPVAETQVAPTREQRIAAQAEELRASHDACALLAAILANRTPQTDTALLSSTALSQFRNAAFGIVRTAWRNEGDVCAAYRQSERELVLAAAYCQRGARIPAAADWPSSRPLRLGLRRSGGLSERESLYAEPHSPRDGDPRALADVLLDQACISDDAATIDARIVQRLVVVVDAPEDRAWAADVRVALAAGDLAGARVLLRAHRDADAHARHLLGVLDALSADAQTRRRGYRAVRRAAAEGLPAAMANQALFLMLGVGVYADPEAGAALLRTALSRGLSIDAATWLWPNALANYTLGTFSEALQGLALQADKGDSAALALLGVFNARGLGRPPCDPRCRAIALERAALLDARGARGWALIVRAQLQAPEAEAVREAGIGGMMATYRTQEATLHALASTALSEAMLYPDPPPLRDPYDPNRQDTYGSFNDNSAEPTPAPSPRRGRR